MSLERFQALRSRFSCLVYESYAILSTEEMVSCDFRYSMRGTDQLLVFTHTVRFSHPGNRGVSADDPLFHRAVFLLGLAEAVSYWKTACPYRLEVAAGALAEEEEAFWERLFTRGLGEFWWLNGIYGHVPEDGYLKVLSTTRPEGPAPVCPVTLAGSLVPVGGGKDSVVTLELLKRLEEDPEASDCFLLSARQASYETAELAGYGSERRMEAFRIFDPQLFALNREGYLNGHVPYSAILGFTAAAAALLRGRRYIVLSNEGSANEPTVPGTWVNHQYSKSLEFEQAFTAYLRNHLSPALSYFSLLRPWSEARIAMAFAGHPLYHAAFRSCNRGAKENRWCCDCAKCLFVFLLVAAHAGVPATAAMFGENLLEKASLTPLLEELAGFAPVKPFECVGTVAETRWSLARILADPALPAEASDWALAAHARTLMEGADIPAFRLVEPELGHLIPPAFQPLVLPEASETAARIRQKLGGLHIGILGYGMEGRSTFRFLQRLFPGGQMTVADQDPEKLADLPDGIPTGSGAGYAEALSGCDLIFKAPGIPWKTVDHLFPPEKVTSQTDLFLEMLGDRTIGVTGTKGKSTTSALIHAALLACGHDAALVGNIGLPALDVVLADQPGRLYVCELSSHMLETIRHAPRGAVYLNLYADHLDHYRSFDDYAAAKDNLLRLQSADGFAIVGENVAARTRGLGPAERHRVSVDAAGQLQLPMNGVSALPAVLPAEAFETSALPGAYNLGNLRTAFLAAHLWESRAGGNAAGLSAPALQAAVLHGLNRFSGLPHRLRQVACIKGIRFWDDSICTIPEACILGIESVGDVDTLIFGGLDRGINYEGLITFLSSGRVRNLIGLPDSGHRILDRLAEGGSLAPDLQLFHAADMDQAVETAFRETEAGRSCLLSPAAASYGWYRNFAERGDHFVRLVTSHTG